MNKRIFEVLVILGVVACLVVFLRTEAPLEDMANEVSARPAAPSTPVARMQLPPAGPAVREAALRDFELAEGMSGYEEVRALEVPALGRGPVLKGADLYKANCATCHGSDGLGGGETGKVLDPPPADLTTPGRYKYGHLELGVFRTSKYGVVGTGMAPWEGILDDEELWCITAYVMNSLQSFPPSASATPAP